MLPKTRLGKRSPLGALVCTSCPSMESTLETGGHGEPEGGVGSPTMGPPGPQHLSRFNYKLHPGQKVYVLCGGRECTGVVEQHNHVDNEVAILLPALGQHVLRKLQDVWTSPAVPPQPPTATQSTGRPHQVSSCIDVPNVPRRSPESLDMDEMMAALVLTSLSCSPLVQSPPQRDTVIAGSTGMECGGGELSDSGSSGYWSCDRGYRSPAPSPPITETEGHSLATPTDEGLEMELEQVLFDEPAPRKRRNSVKVAYRCLWPNCGKILTSVVGIKRHIRTLHLGQSGEHERCSHSEEDFYYTEIHQRELQPLTPPPVVSTQPPIPTTSTITPWLACAFPSSSSPSGVGPGEPGVGAGAGGDSPTEVSPQPIQLSQSAPSTPGCFGQVHSEHSYQAPASVQVVAPPISVSSCRWTTPTSTPQPRQILSHQAHHSLCGQSVWENSGRSSRMPQLGHTLPAPLPHAATGPQGGSVERLRSVVRCTASSTGINGAPPVAGRKPASASMTEPLTEEKRDEEQERVMEEKKKVRDSG